MVATSQLISLNDLTVHPDVDLEDLIPDFVVNRRADLGLLEEAMTKQNFDFIKSLGHTLKGISRPYGFVYLESLSKRLEAAGEQQDLNQIQSLFDEIKYYLDNVKIVY